MDYSSQEDTSIGIPTHTPAPAPASAPAASLAYHNPNPIRVSAFSKPPPSLPSPKGNGSAAHDHLLHPSAADPVPLFAVTGASAATTNSGSTPKSATSTAAIKYRECLRNHAVAIGGHVLDGCCEFMPGDADPLKCAACDCHRSFHRKHTEGGGSLDSYYHRRDRISVPLLLPPPHPLTHTANRYKQQQQQLGGGGAFPASPSGVVPGSSAVVAFGGGGSGSGATTESSSEEQLDHAGGGPPPVVIVSKKRFRTKFTAEQKEKMMGFAERVGWRIQRQDDATVEQFCREVGIRRQVFKVWMHNNKHSTKKQHQQQQPQIESQQQQQQQLQHQPVVVMRGEI